LYGRPDRREVAVQVDGKFLIEPRNFGLTSVVLRRI